MVDESTVESVIQRRIEPSSFEWLAQSEGTPAPELALLKRAQRHLSTLHRVSELLSNARDINSCRKRRSARSSRSSRPTAARSSCAAATPRPGRLKCWRRGRRRTPTERFTVSRTLVADVIARGLSVFAHDASSDARFSEGQSVIGQRVRSVMCVPLRTTDEILGALYVDSLSGAGRFNESDLELLAAIGNQAGVAMHRVRLVGELERLLLDTIKAIAATIDARDGYTHRHSERVAALTAQLALEMGLSDADRADGASCRRCCTTSARSPSRTRSSTSRAGSRPRSSPRCRSIRCTARRSSEHPERDGQGGAAGRAVSPREVGRHRLSRRAQGEAIPFLGRLLGVADFYDALTSARAYRGAMPRERSDQADRGRRRQPFRSGGRRAAVRLFERGELQTSTRCRREILTRMPPCRAGPA